MLLPATHPPSEGKECHSRPSTANSLSFGNESDAWNKYWYASLRAKISHRTIEQPARRPLDRDKGRPVVHEEPEVTVQRRHGLAQCGLVRLRKQCSPHRKLIKSAWKVSRRRNNPSAKRCTRPVPCPPGSHKVAPPHSRFMLIIVYYFQARPPPPPPRHRLVTRRPHHSGPPDRPSCCEMCC